MRLPAMRFNLSEWAGSLGDLGTLLPLAIGMILVNGLNPLGLLLGIGIYYLVAGLYFGVPTPVQPMKVIGAYAVATAASGEVVMAAALLVGVLLLALAFTGAADLLGRYIPKSVIRGVQLSTGVLLMGGGVKLVLGKSEYQLLRQAAEPHMWLQSLGPIPVGVVIGLVFGVLTLLLLDNRRLPAGLVVVLGGMGLGWLFNSDPALAQVSLGWHWPQILPLGWPGWDALGMAAVALVLPQIPMTMGNAVFANADLSRQYFGEASTKVTPKAICVSMGLANLMVFLLGGMPMCHGAGGLAAHYRFGARTVGNNIIIGLVFVFLAIGLGSGALAVIHLLPMAILGVLLVFAGGQLAMVIGEVTGRKDLFVSLLILGITMASNLAVGFLAGIVVAYILRWEKLSV